MIAAFAAVFVALYAAHQVADHWVQTQHQADHKGLPGWRGRRACVMHVATYTVTAALALLVLAAVTGWLPDPGELLAGLAVSGLSHYLIDRRVPLRRLVDLLGKDPGWLERGGGMYALDQSAHVLFLFIAALIIA